MTFDDDFLQLNFDHKQVRTTCKSLGVTWPPPEKLTVGGFELRRIRFSAITDEQREKLTMIVRGAEYEPQPAPPTAEG